MNYNKVNKATARKIYNHGLPIFLIPCKCRFISPDSEDHPFNWIQPHEISILNCDEKENQFDRTVNAYEYYNCNAELGYYSAYYVREQDYDSYKMCNIMCS